MTDNEKKAIQLSENPEELCQRLFDAKACLTRPIQLHFAPWKFDFHRKCLVGLGSTGAILQWKTRRCPEKPISYENQQTNNGTVVFKEAQR